MKKRVLFALFTCLAAAVFSQPVVYFDFVSHNEETAQWNGTPYYTTNRSKIIALADYFQTRGVTWNMQSDWVFLNNVLSKETPALMAGTGNKNVLRWLHEDKGVEMDPHAHESQYLYPDVVKLMDSIGLPESKLMGGTIYNNNNGLNIWTNLVNGQHGIIFPSKFWRPDYMMGGGTPNHVDDLKYYGFWNPQSPSSYLTHDTTSRLRHIGIGCDMKIDATTTAAGILADLKEVVQKVQSGQYPADGFYLQNIFFEQGDLNNIAVYSQVTQVADSVNAMVLSGVAQWKTLKQAYTSWETDDHAEKFQWQCGQLVANTEPGYGQQIRICPNPFSRQIKALNATGDEQYELCNALGQLIWTGTDLEQEDFSDLKAGIYVLKIRSRATPEIAFQKLLKL